MTRTLIIAFTILLTGQGIPSAAQELLSDSIPQSRALAFIRSLSPAQKDSVVYRFDDPQRKRWSNNSYNIARRPGLSLEALTDTQRILLQSLLQAALSPQGYLKVMNAIRQDDYLHQFGASLNDPYAAYYGSDYYWIAFFGIPPGSKNWGWKFEGHHLSLNFGFQDGKPYATPFFIGAHPDLIRSGPYAGFRFLSDEKQEALALAASLNGSQKNLARISDSLPLQDDIRARTGKEAFLRRPEGIPIGMLHDGQKKILLALLKNFTGNFSTLFERSILRQPFRQFTDSLHFAWMGPWSDPDQLYYALEAPGFSIEFIVKEPLHIHSVMWSVAQR
jgi:hypothetical protein